MKGLLHSCQYLLVSSHLFVCRWQKASIQVEICWLLPPPHSPPRKCLEHNVTNHVAQRKPFLRPKPPGVGVRSVSWWLPCFLRAQPRDHTVKGSFPGVLGRTESWASWVVVLKARKHPRWIDMLSKFTINIAQAQQKQRMSRRSNGLPTWVLAYA